MAGFIEETLKTELGIFLATHYRERGIICLTVEPVEGSEIYRGLMGEVVFMRFKFKDVPGRPGNDLVLKRSRKLDCSHLGLPIELVYEKEMTVHDTVLRDFRHFQRDKGIRKIEVFCPWPKFFGSLKSENKLNMVMENLISSGYSLWDKKLPLPYELLLKTVEIYAKFHAISLAMSDQEPDHFDDLVRQIEEPWKSFDGTGEMIKVIQENAASLKNSVREKLGEEVLSAWITFLQSIPKIFEESFSQKRDVIVHGDSRITNFLYKFEENILTGTAMLDFQLSGRFSPILDLSSLLYNCISPDDLKNNFEEVLKHYHRTLSEFTRKLGSDAEKLFPFDTLRADWKTLGKFGIVIATLAIKECFADERELSEWEEFHYTDFYKNMALNSANNQLYLERILAVIQHASQCGLL